MNLQANITTIKGVGDKSASLFCKLGIITIEDLLRYYPRTYIIYEPPVPILEAELGMTLAVEGRIQGEIQTKNHRGLHTSTIRFTDGSESLRVTWFRMPFLKQVLPKHTTFVLYGKIFRKQGVLCMDHPEIFHPTTKYLEKLDGLQPVYSLTKGITNTFVQKIMWEIWKDANFSLQDYLPSSILDSYCLPELTSSVSNMHHPSTREDFFQARKRLVFDEFLLFTLTIQSMKNQRERPRTSVVIRDQIQVQEVMDALPYTLTHAQQTAWQSIRTDLMGDYVMERLVQGDVGSGKTIVAVLALLLCICNGYQAAYMAPTEVLARQHFQAITKILSSYCKVVLLTGSLTSKEKREVYQQIQSGEVDLIIGTHALFQEKVTYHKLALVVTDEQHRFGVKQREMLANKGQMPHVLVMSATPIPRTLAVILYGDLDLSIMNEKPMNRLAIKNCVVNTDYRSTAYRFMKQEVQSGRQCYIICPMVEESETSSDLANVTDYAKNLQQIFGLEVQVACLHGRMKQQEKDRIMESYSSGEIHVLVSTTVIEVGIDVPNATVIMIENSERFGLAQLHQLRGRVGRGEYQSYCIFMTSSKNKDTLARLEILNQSNDGFFIAEEDMKLRGSGDIFGIRQSGWMEFEVGDIFQDAEILKMAHEAAKMLMEEDPELKLEKHKLLKKRLLQYQARNMERMIL